MASRPPASGTLPLAAFSSFLTQLNAAHAATTLEDLLGALAIALNELGPDSSVYAGFYRREAPPIVLDFAGPDEWNRIYPNGFYLLDPTYEAFMAGSESVCLMPNTVFPSDFRKSEYYLSYYRPHRMVDEICYLIYLQPNLAAYISMMRLGSSVAFTATETKRIAAALPSMETLAQRIWQLHAQPNAGADDASQQLHQHLASAYEEFGREELSEREAEVTRLLLKGLSPKAVGRLLKIAPGTVRNHIKRIYVKMGVRTQAELMAFFFEILSNSAVPVQRQ